MAEVALQERVAHLEGRVENFHARFDSLDRQISRLELRVDALNNRIDAVDQKVDRFREELGGQIAELHRKIDHNFQWTTGINVVLWSTILVALVFRT